MTATTTGLTYAAAPNKVIRGTNGIDYAYREIGNGTVPLVLLQHFRGNLDNWDPPLVDELGAQRHVVAFDNVGVGATTGVTPDTIEQMARDALALIAALDVPQVDILGFSIGSFTAQGDRVNPARDSSPAGVGRVGTARRGGDARLGARSDRRGRQTAAGSGRLPQRVLHLVIVEPPGGRANAGTHLRPHQ